MPSTKHIHCLNSSQNRTLQTPFSHNSLQIWPMKSLNPSPESCRRNGVIGLGLIPDHGQNTITIKVSHGLNQYEVAVPSNSSFGYLKSVIAQKVGLKPEMHKLLFRGKEKEDDEDLQTAGVKDISEVLLMEDTTSEQKSPEEVQENNVISKGGAAVAEVREEVDKLSQQASALQAIVDSGTKVDNKEIIYLSEMLMRQLLKLDGIEAEGEGKVQRKMEVRRVQSIVEKLDVLKSRNSNPFSIANETVSVTTQPETFNSDCGSVRSVTTPWETFEPGCGNVNFPSPMPYTAPSPMPYSAPSTVPSSSPSAVPYVPYPMPSFTPSSVPSYVPYPMPYFTPSTAPYYIPYGAPSYSPYGAPSYTPSGVPYSVPSPMPSSAPSPMPSSTKVTQNWEQFG